MVGVASATPVSAGVNLEVITSEARFDMLRGRWNALAEKNAVSVFQTFEWQRTWWKFFGEGRTDTRLHTITLSDGEGLIGIAPFFIEEPSMFGVAPFRRMLFLGSGMSDDLLGSGMSDYLDFIIRKGREQEFADQLADYLSENRSLYDVLFLTDIPSRSESRDRVYQTLSEAGLRGSRFVSDHCPRLMLSGTWEKTLDSMKGNHRRQMKKRLRQLRESSAVGLEVISAKHLVAEAIDEFIAMHQYRWTRVGELGALPEERSKRFMREVAQLFWDRGWLFLGFLLVDGRRVAVNLGFLFQDEFLYYLNGIRAAELSRHYAPGLVLHLLCMEKAVQMNLGVYDFLRGTERYKYELGATDMANWSMVFYRNTSQLLKARHKAILLTASLRRRLRKEWQLWKYTTRTHGLLSFGVARYTLRRFLGTLGEGWKKARAPERPVDRRQKRELSRD
jgi:CelD/BcsL family acetyltransferase involved in cellulose biosynthesis